MTTTTKYSEKCRLCLKNSGIYDVFQTPELVQDIFLSIGMEITRSSSLPRRICMKCFKIVSNTKNLRKVSMENELLLRAEYNYGDELLNDTVQQSDVTNHKSNSIGEDNVSSTNDTNEDPLNIFDDSVRVKRERSSSPENESVMKVAVRADLFRKSLLDKPPMQEEGTYIEGTKYGISKQFTIRDSKPIDVQYTCAECPKSFATWKKVYLHQRIHNKTITCPVKLCAKMFAARGDMRKHLRTHTGERPYKCSICNKGFTQKCSLRVHNQTLHNIETLVVYT